VAAIGIGLVTALGLLNEELWSVYTRIVESVLAPS
jgi:hypothetical protein